MIVAVCTLELQLPGVGSLKGKRQIVQSVLARVRHEFNVSIAEVEQQDTWQLATLGIACVSSDAVYARGLLERVVQYVEETRPDTVLLDYQIELL